MSDGEKGWSFLRKAAKSGKKWARRKSPEFEDCTGCRRKLEHPGKFLGLNDCPALSDDQKQAGPPTFEEKLRNCGGSHVANKTAKTLVKPNGGAIMGACRHDLSEVAIGKSGSTCSAH